MAKIDAFIELLKDSKWHEKTELQESLGLDEHKTREIMAFLGEYNLVKIDHKNGKIRLNRDFKKLLIQHNQ